LVLLDQAKRTYKAKLYDNNPAKDGTELRSECDYYATFLRFWKYLQSHLQIVTLMLLLTPKCYIPKNIKYW